MYDPDGRMVINDDAGLRGECLLSMRPGSCSGDQPNPPGRGAWRDEAKTCAVGGIVGGGIGFVTGGGWAGAVKGAVLSCAGAVAGEEAKGAARARSRDSCEGH